MSQQIKIDSAIEPLLHAWSGASASALATLILYPLENIKTRAQIESKKKQKQAQENIKIKVDLTKEQKISLRKIADQVFKEEGPSGFYKGLSALLTGNCISYGIYFYFYELVKDLLKIEVGNLKGYSLASLLAGSATSVGTNPFWVINTRMTCSKENLNFLQTIKQIVQQEGFTSLYKGLSASLFLVINPIIQFSVYEYLKIKIGKTKHQFLLYFIAGAISKIIATYITYPTQVVRTHQHLNKSGQKQSTIQIIQKLLKQGGIGSLYTGVNAKLLQSVLNSAFMLAFYEKVFRIVRFFYIQFFLKKAVKV